jgi:hypothetical protein
MGPNLKVLLLCKISFSLVADWRSLSIDLWSFFSIKVALNFLGATEILTFDSAAVTLAEC